MTYQERKNWCKWKHWSECKDDFERMTFFAREMDRHLPKRHGRMSDSHDAMMVACLSALSLKSCLAEEIISLKSCLAEEQRAKKQLEEEVATLKASLKRRDEQVLTSSSQPLPMVVSSPPPSPKEEKVNLPVKHGDTNQQGTKQTVGSKQEVVKSEPIIDAKTSPLPLQVKKPHTQPRPSIDIKKTYLQAFAQNNIDVMNTLNQQVTDKKSVYIPKSSLVSRDQSPRRERIVVIGVPQDTSTDTTDKCLDFLTSLRVISPADRVHMKCITERTTRAHKRILTVSLDDSRVRQQILQKNAWTSNTLLPTWGISVFPDHTFRERKTTP